MSKILDKIKEFNVDRSRKKFMTNLEQDEKEFAMFIIGFVEIPEISKALKIKDKDYQHFLIKNALEKMRDKQHPLITPEQLRNL